MKQMVSIRHPTMCNTAQHEAQHSSSPVFVRVVLCGANPTSVCTTATLIKQDTAKLIVGARIGTHVSVIQNADQVAHLEVIAQVMLWSHVLDISQLNAYPKVVLVVDIVQLGL